MCQRCLHVKAALPLILSLLTVLPAPVLAGKTEHDGVFQVASGIRRIINAENEQYIANSRGGTRAVSHRQVIQSPHNNPLHEQQRSQDQREQEDAHQQQPTEQEEDDEEEQDDSLLPYDLPPDVFYPKASVVSRRFPPIVAPRLRSGVHLPDSILQYGRISYPARFPDTRHPYDISVLPYHNTFVFRLPEVPGGFYSQRHPGPTLYPSIRSPTLVRSGRTGAPRAARILPCDKVHSVRCHNDLCVAKEAVCDGVNDCGDMADETDCVLPRNCTQYDFQCANHECVPQAWRCDGETDCLDNSDELNCTTSPCSEYEFSCGDGSCISAGMHCNDIPECPDNSDELNCNEPHGPVCDGDELTCKYPWCVLKEYECDGDNDCGDWTDEKNCELRRLASQRGGGSGAAVMSSAIEAVCSEHQFHCTDGACIPMRARCNGQGDCENGEDEEGCENSDRSPHTCPPGQRACNAGRCISASWFCDGEVDCSRGEDEDNCAHTCNLEKEFKCGTESPANSTTATSVLASDVVCIKKYRVCDGHEDCPAGDDEAGCPVPIQCEANSRCFMCLKASNGSIMCGCKKGYALGADGVSCVDVNECSEENDPCQHECRNVEGSFTCSCRDGYVLKSDRLSCKSVRSVAKLIITNRIDIREVNLNTQHDSVVVPRLHNAVALDIHYARNEIYWIDFSMHVLKRAYINGSDQVDLVRWGLQESNGLAIDWIHDLMFWSDSGLRKIQVSTLDGTSVYTIVRTGLDKPRDIAVSPRHGLIFYTDWGPNPRVERLAMDGSNRKPIITKDIVWPNGLALDTERERLYWTDARYHVIETATMDGADRRVLVSKGLPHPFALTVFEEEIYWTDWHTKSVMAADKSGRKRRALLTKLHYPMQLHSFHNLTQQPAPNRCPRPPNHCRYLCLPNLKGYTCVCPIGTKLLNDGVTCERLPKNVLLYLRNKEIRILGIPTKGSNSDGKHDVTSPSVQEEIIPVTGVRSAVSLDWDEEEDLVFWSDKKSATISCAHRNGTGQRIIVDTHLQYPISISLDYVTRRLYFIDAVNKRIESVNLNGSLRVVLIWRNLHSPQSLIVHPPARQMVWADDKTMNESYSKKRILFIEAAGMDGDNRRTLKAIPVPAKVIVKIHIALAVDPIDGRIYWSHSGTENIESMMLDGTGESTLEQTDSGFPVGLAVLGGKIFWADNFTGRIRGKNPSAVLRSGVTSLRGISLWHSWRSKMPNPCSVANNNGGCAHICLLAYPPPAITCKCRIGYTLLEDKKSCSKWPNASLLMVRNTEFRRFPLNLPYFMDESMPLPKMQNVVAADVDTITGEIYWSEADAGVIMRAPSEGGNKAVTVIRYVGRSFGLAIDPVNRNIHWTDNSRGTVEVQNLDGGWRRVLICKDLESPYAMAILPEDGLMFWSDWGGQMGKIEKAQMDGSGRATILSENIGWPNALTLDAVEKRIFWTDLKTNTLESANFDGASRKIVQKELPNPYGVALYEDYIYWSDWKTTGLHRVRRNGTNEAAVMTGLQPVLDIKVLQPIPKNRSSCVDRKCSHLCLPAPKPKGYSCACPTGLPLLPDGHNCSVLPEAQLLFALGRGPPMGRMALPPLRYHDAPITLGGVLRTAALDYHWNEKLVVFASTRHRSLLSSRHQASSIMVMSLANLSNPISIVNTSDGYVEGITVDWVANNIFWTDVARSVIEVARLNGSSRRTIFRSPYSNSSLRSITVFPRKGFLFWSDWQADGQPISRIERSGLDGSNRTTIAETDLGRPNGLTVDYNKHRLFWADSGRGRIECSFLDGSERTTLIHEAPHLFGLTIHGDHIYWTNYELHTVERADKMSGLNRLAVETAMWDIRDVKTVSESRQRPGGACAVGNGGCSHLCLAHPGGYLCACPDIPGRCVEKEMPYEDPYPDDRETDDPYGGADTSKNTSNDLSTVLFFAFVVSAIMAMLMLAIAGVFLLCRRNIKRPSTYQPSEPVVITFTNPFTNYYSLGGSCGPAAESGPGEAAGSENLVNAADADGDAADVSGDRYPILWRRLKYDKTMECGCKCRACDQGSLHLHVEIENLKQRLVERDRHIVTMETNFLSEADKFPDGEYAALTEELLTWQEKYSRLYESYKRVQKVNQGLEDKLLRVVDKCESEKGALTRDVASLTQRLVDSRFDVTRLQEESERYRNDLNLAIQLLQCKPANFIPQKYEQLPVDLQQKVRSYVNTKRKSIDGIVTQPKIERRTIKVPIPTFPPTAMVYSVNKTLNDKDTSDEEKEIGSDGHPPVDVVSAAILAKILQERERERLTVRHCETCSCPSRNSMVDASTQTIPAAPQPALPLPRRNDSPSPVRMNLRYSSSLLGSGEASQVLVSLADDTEPTVPAPTPSPGLLNQSSSRVPLIPAPVSSSNRNSGWDDWGRGESVFDNPPKCVGVETKATHSNNNVSKANGLALPVPRVGGNNRVESSVMVGPMAGAAGSRKVETDLNETRPKPVDSVIIKLESPPAKDAHNSDVSHSNNNFRSTQFRRPHSSGTTTSDTSDSVSRSSYDCSERRTSSASLRGTSTFHEKSPSSALPKETPPFSAPKESRPSGPIPCSLRFQAGTNNILLDNTHSFAPVLYTSRQNSSPQSSQNSVNSLSSNHSSHGSSRSNNASAGASASALSRSGSVSSTDDGWSNVNANDSPSTSENSDVFNNIPTSQNNQRPHRVTINRTETGV